MTVKTLSKIGALGVLASMVIGVLHLVSPEALHRAMAAITSAVWGS